MDELDTSNDEYCYYTSETFTEGIQPYQQEDFNIFFISSYWTIENIIWDIIFEDVCCSLESQHGVTSTATLEC